MLIASADGESPPVFSANNERSAFQTWNDYDAMSLIEQIFRYPLFWSAHNLFQNRG